MTDSSPDVSEVQQLHSLIEQEAVTSNTVLLFQQVIRNYYGEHGRIFPWRQTRNPYHILVSEIMLQQTQTSRVVDKYEEFVAYFPDFLSLAEAPVRAVLQAWQGLGYNRRAIALQRIAQKVLADLDGELPSSPETLETFPGIGRYTASAVAALAFNKPVAFVETNIRAVFLYFFFKEKTGVTDREILPLVEATMDKANLREWYYALFDYGAMLKKREKLTAQSAHYHKQGPFKGSNREVRGKVLRLILAHSPITEEEVIGEVRGSPLQVREVIRQLQKEGFISHLDTRILRIQGIFLT